MTTGVGWQGMRLALYAVAAAASILLVATVSRQRLVALDSAPVALGFGFALGLLLAVVAPVLDRLSGAAGCGTFAVASLALAVLAWALVGTALPGISVTFAGSLVGAVISTVACGAVFTLLDERPRSTEDGRADG